jgi:hypothetical protein
VQEALKLSKLQQGAKLYENGQLTPEIATVLNINIQEVIDFLQLEAKEVNTQPPTKIANFQGKHKVRRKRSLQLVWKTLAR